MLGDGNALLGIVLVDRNSAGDVHNRLDDAARAIQTHGRVYHLWLRSASHAGAMPGVRHCAGEARGGTNVKRRIFNVLAGLSLVLCVVTIVLWVLSYGCPYENRAFPFGRI